MSIFGPLDNLLQENAQLRADLAAAREREQRMAEFIRDALDCLPRALDGSSPFSMSQRAEVMLAIESLNRALAAAAPSAVAQKPRGEGV